MDDLKRNIRATVSGVDVAAVQAVTRQYGGRDQLEFLDAADPPDHERPRASIETALRAGLPLLAQVIALEHFLACDIRFMGLSEMYHTRASGKLIEYVDPRFRTELNDRATSSGELVTFAVADAKQPFPADVHGTFDLVHVRALVAALAPNDWGTVVENLLQLLKPGGALQWSEGDVSRVRCMRGTVELHAYSSLPRLLAAFEAKMGERLAETGRKLPEAFRRQNLSNVEMDWTSSDRDPGSREEMTRLFPIGLLGWAAKTALWPTQEIEAIRDGAAADIDNGAYIRVDGLTIIGRKSPDA